MILKITISHQWREVNSKSEQFDDDDDEGERKLSRNLD